MIKQADLFRADTDAPEEWKHGSWFYARFVSWEYVQSPTQGEMRRLVGELLDGSGQAIYKPLTQSIAGIRWAERALKALGFPPRQLASLRRRGIGEYLDELCRALVRHGRLSCTLYPFPWKDAEGKSIIFWTCEKVRRA